ncbi:MAG: di-heme oxidoredictase family protein [Longimicrobiales bacterium]
MVGERIALHAAGATLQQCRIALLLLVAGCGGTTPDSPESTGPPGSALPGLDSARIAVFEEGKALFDREFTPEEGLGPLFNQKRCSSCHDLPTLGGEGAEPITKVTRYDGPDRCDLLVDFGGDNIQESATPLLREFGIPYESIPATANAVGAIIPPPLYGVGLIEAIPEAQITRRADPDDQDGDGISGRVGRTTDGRVGRFGRKADIANLPDFVDGAIRFEQGITTPAHPVEEMINGKPIPPGTDPARDPEIDARRLGLLIDYVRYLAAPEREVATAAAADTIAVGERIFADAGCAGCHTPALQTGSGPVEALAGKTVRLYSDLLLHDMGEDLASVCGVGASPSEWRTPPLMGLRSRLSFLHDGSAGSYDQALRRHGGEAAAARAAYHRLSEADRTALFRFLLSL